MLKAVSLIEKETLQIPADELDDEIDDDIIENETGPENRLEKSSDESDIDDISNSIDPDSTSQILNENQIFELLNEDIENIDVQFEQSEQIINYVELQEIGDTSIFTSK
uniref:Uncharacterized protein n=1 Tax=Schizaphis graminum TaxID=13262 RepID=A0A2S2PA97_SCHGA